MLSRFAPASLLALLLSAGLATAEDAAASDPADSLAGLWRTEHAVGASAASVPAGKLMRINRTAITGFTTGACTNPTFRSSKNQSAITVTITCLGQAFATAEWQAKDPDFVMWEEGSTLVSLRRVATRPTTAGSSGDSAQ
jgi:hypothetical protein